MVKICGSMPVEVTSVAPRLWTTEYSPGEKADDQSTANLEVALEAHLIPTKRIATLDVPC
jgi:hypothetical protein